MLIFIMLLQLVISYCSPWYCRPAKMRQEELRDGHAFTCYCRACKEDWPVAEGLISAESRIWVQKLNIDLSLKLLVSFLKFVRQKYSL